MVDGNGVGVFMMGCPAWPSMRSNAPELSPFQPLECSTSAIMVGLFLHVQPTSPPSMRYFLPAWAWAIRAFRYVAFAKLDSLIPLDEMIRS